MGWDGIRCDAIGWIYLISGACFALLACCGVCLVESRSFEMLMTQNENMMDDSFTDIPPPSSSNPISLSLVSTSFSTISGSIHPSIHQSNIAMTIHIPPHYISEVLSGRNSTAIHPSIRQSVSQSVSPQWAFLGSNLFLFLFLFFGNELSVSSLG